MNENQKIPCPKCGEMMNATARYCMKCGTINPNLETNRVLTKSIQKSINDYKTGKSPLLNESNSNIGIANNTGNRKFAFYVTYLLYLFCVIVIGLATYLTGINTLDLLIISSYPMTVILLSIAFLYIYGIELVFMKCNKPWWAGLVPIYNLMVLGDIAFHNKYIGLLSFVPIIGQLFLLVVLYQIGVKFKYNGLLTALLSVVYIPIIGYGDHLYEGKTFVSTSDNKSLEKDYRYKKIFFGTLILLLLGGVALFIMGNMGKVRKANRAINGTYYVLASSKIAKQVSEAAENSTFQCFGAEYNPNAGVYYVVYGDVGDKIHLPLYMMREAISGYAKIDNDKNPREISISLTDGIYGFRETLESEIDADTVREYTSLEDVPTNQVCEIGP